MEMKMKMSITIRNLRGKERKGEEMNNVSCVKKCIAHSIIRYHDRYAVLMDEWMKEKKEE